MMSQIVCQKSKYLFFNFIDYYLFFAACFDYVVFRIIVRYIIKANLIMN